MSTHLHDDGTLLIRHTPVQLIKAVWGLRGSENNCDLTLIGDDSTLMDMDAPESMPAGSMQRYEAYSHIGVIDLRETSVLR